MSADWGKIRLSRGIEMITFRAKAARGQLALAPIGVPLMLDR
jgi:hypothetical protein